MDRRTYSAHAVTAGLLGLAGCLCGRLGPGGERGTDSSDDVELQIWNQRSVEQQVQVTISSEDETIVDRTITVGAGDSKGLETGIEGQGQYELRALLDDGSSASYPFSIETYDLRDGSDLIVEITTDRVNLMMEE